MGPSPFRHPYHVIVVEPGPEGWRYAHCSRCGVRFLEDHSGYFMDMSCLPLYPVTRVDNRHVEPNHGVCPGCGHDRIDHLDTPNWKKGCTKCDCWFRYQPETTEHVPEWARDLINHMTARHVTFASLLMRAEETLNKLHAVTLAADINVALNHEGDWSKFVCSCHEFTVAVAMDAITPMTVDDHPRYVDGTYWFIEGHSGFPKAPDGFPLRIETCPYCGKSVREVNR